MFWSGTVNQNKALMLIEFIFWFEDTREEMNIRQKINMFSGICAMRRMTDVFTAHSHLNDYHVL